MLTPPYLQKGDKIAFVAPARKIDSNSIERTIEIFNNNGFEVVCGRNLFHSCNQFSGTTDERLEDLQYFLNSREVKAIICARGGYGTVQLVDKIDFTEYVKFPKWVVGYSDITVLHSHIHKQFGIETLHATMPVNICSESYDSSNLITLIQGLTGALKQYTIEGNGRNVLGKCNGELVGGNLSILYSLIGSKSDIDTTGKILFIEDIDEYLYHIDRMMTSLKRSGKLKNIKGLIVGGMTDMKDNEIPFGEDAYEIISRIVEEYNYPVCFNFPAGHGYRNFALILGRKIELNVQQNACSLTFY